MSRHRSVLYRFSQCSKDLIKSQVYRLLTAFTVADLGWFPGFHGTPVALSCTGLLL